jgi:hypothetical protein
MVAATLKSFLIIAERAGLSGGEPPRQRAPAARQAKAAMAAWPATC